MAIHLISMVISNGDLDYSSVTAQADDDIRLEGKQLMCPCLPRGMLMSAAFHIGLSIHNNCTFASTSCELGTLAQGAGGCLHISVITL